MRRQKKLWTSLLAALLAVCLTAALPVYLAPPASAVTQEEIDALKNSAKDLDSQKKDLQQQLAAVAADKNKALEQKALLEQQIAVLNTQIVNIRRPGSWPRRRRTRPGSTSCSASGFG